MVMGDLGRGEATGGRLLGVAAAKAAAGLGGWSLDLHDFPDIGFCTVRPLDLVKTIEKAIAEFPPVTLLTHFPGDLNRDHQFTSAAAQTAVRPSADGIPANLA